MAYKDGGKSGGRKPGSKNKLTLALAKMREEAMAKINEELGELAFKGDAVEFLQAIYKSPHFDPDIRLQAAKDVAQFERAKKTETTVEDKTHYIVHMPAPLLPDATRREQAAEWRKLYGGADTPAEDDARAEKVAIAQAQAAENKTRTGILCEALERYPQSTEKQ
jgi:hypothetical protein